MFSVLNLSSRPENTLIHFFNSTNLGYYTCVKGYCIEIYNLTCERRCDSLEFKMKQKNSVIYSAEKIIIADCSSRSTPTDTIRDSVSSRL